MIFNFHWQFFLYVKCKKNMLNSSLNNLSNLAIALANGRLREYNKSNPVKCQIKTAILLDNKEN